MNASKEPLRVLLEQTIRLVAPLFQRPYVWDQDNWEPLWETIRDAADRIVDGRQERSHFLGALVLEQQQVPAGRLGDVRQIIDGQQRLTTMQLLLAALRDIAEAGALDFEVDTFTRLTKNHTPRQEDEFKVVPTTDDQDQFTRTMTAGSPAAVRKAAKQGDPDHLLPRCYLYFHDQATQWLADHDLKSGLDVLAQVLQDHLVVVVINLDGQTDDAQEIFETLNARGEDLEPADLAKNFLLQRLVGTGVDIDKVRAAYEAYWREFDRDKAYWRKRIRQGRLIVPRMNLFLQNYLTLKRKDEVLASNLFGEFRLLAKSRAPEDQLAEIRAYADQYRRLDTLPSGSYEHLVLYQIEQLDVATLQPVLLESAIRHATGTLDDVSYAQILQDVDSYLVRRAVCGLSSKAYNRMVAELTRKLEGSWSAESVREFLLDQRTENNVWPTDDDFREAWTSEPLYKGRRARVRMILESLERALRSDMTEKLDFGDSLTVEHLMPQSWKTHWPLLDGTGEQFRNHVIHTIGNLTLLTSALNPTVSNGPWIPKRAKILEFSALSLNRELQDVDTWDEARMATRANHLFGHALKLWPRPADDRGAHALAPARPKPGPDATQENTAAPFGASAEESHLLERLAARKGGGVRETLASLAVELAPVGVSLRPRRSSFSARLAIPGRRQKFSLFFVDMEGRVQFGWLPGQLERVGLPAEFADNLYRKLAERYGLLLKKGTPDGLTLDLVATAPELFASDILEFVEHLRDAIGKGQPSTDDDLGEVDPE